MKITIICKYCNKDFIGNSYPKRLDVYCNKICMSQAFLKPKTKYICRTCNNEFFRHKLRIYCSKKCLRYTGDRARLKSLEGTGFWQNSTWEQKLERYRTLFESKVIKTDGCWGWNGFLDTTGSGRIGPNNFQIHAYKISWILYNGEIPQGLCVLHKCHNRACTNPEHLYVGTNKDNTQDMLRAGRGNFNKQNSKNAKLTKEKAFLIKQLLKDGISQFKIAAQFKVSRGTIQDIHRNKTWRDA